LQEFSQHGAQLHNISEQPEQNNMFDREKKRKRLNAGAGKLELLAVYLIINNVVLFYSDRMSTTLREAGISPLFEGSRSFSCSPCLDGSINNFVNLIFVMVIQTQFVVDFVLDG
jgi:hypothetical protein